MILKQCWIPQEQQFRSPDELEFRRRNRNKSPAVVRFEVFTAVTIENADGLLVTANVVRSSLILVTLMTEVLNSYETSVLTRAHMA
jgi:hypothetical protein